MNLLWWKKTKPWDPFNPYAEEIKRFKSDRKRLRSYRRHVNRIKKLTIPYRKNGSGPGVTSIGVGMGMGTVQGVLIHYSANSLKDIYQIYKDLRNAGYKRTGSPQDYAELGRRIYDFSPVILMVFFDLNKEGSGCRVIKTGETKDVMKIICDDSEPNGDSEKK